MERHAVRKHQNVRNLECHKQPSRLRNTLKTAVGLGIYILESTERVPLGLPIFFNTRAGRNFLDFGNLYLTLHRTGSLAFRLRMVTTQDPWISRWAADEDLFLIKKERIEMLATYACTMENQAIIPVLVHWRFSGHCMPSLPNPSLPNLTWLPTTVSATVPCF